MPVRLALFIGLAVAGCGPTPITLTRAQTLELPILVDGELPLVSDAGYHATGRALRLSPEGSGPSIEAYRYPMLLWPSNYRSLADARARWRDRPDWTASELVFSAPPPPERIVAVLVLGTLAGLGGLYLGQRWGRCNEGTECREDASIVGEFFGGLAGVSVGMALGSGAGYLLTDDPHYRLD